MINSAVKRWFLHSILLLTILFMLAPLLIVVVNSFNASAYNAWPPPGFTLSWYRRVIANTAFQHGLINSLFTGITSTIVVLITGLPIARALTQLKGKSVILYGAAVFSPLIVPRVAIGFALFTLFISAASMAGIHLYGSFIGLVLAHSIVMLPFVVTILMASLRDLDPIEEEAARDLGATPLQSFRLAVLPQLQGALVISALLAFITSFDEVEMTLFLVKPSVSTLPVALYHYMDQYQDPSIAALSTLLIAFTFLLALIAPFVVKGKTLLRMMTSGQS